MNTEKAAQRQPRGSMGGMSHVWANDNQVFDEFAHSLVGCQCGQGENRFAKGAVIVAVEIPAEEADFASCLPTDVARHWTVENFRAQMTEKPMNVRLPGKYFC